MSEAPAARYVGRFAPSPTGELHLGSLLTALASFLHARQSGGDWLVRIENVDPPREAPGAADSILRTLEALDLDWDGTAQFQLERLERFEAAARQLLDSDHAFRCQCSRKEIHALTGSRRYPGTCRRTPPPQGPAAIRVIAPAAPISFDDGIQGTVVRDIAATDGDFVIYRRVGLPAYHLAVVLDDAQSRVTDVVRGIDLLDQTPLQIYLQRLLGCPTPRYWHLPVLTNAAGEKLSKQTGAVGIGPLQTAGLATRLLAYLGLELPAELSGARPAEAWDWAIPRWQIQRTRGQTSIEV